MTFLKKPFPAAMCAASKVGTPRRGVRSALFGGVGFSVRAVTLAPLTILLLAGCLFFPAPALLARQETNSETGKTRLVTVSDVIQMALTNNLDILISRYTPILDQLALNGLSSPYDPVFSVTAQRSYNSSGGGVDPTTGFAFPAYTQISRTYSPGISGSLPSGLTYNLSTPIYNEAVPFGLYNLSPGISLTQPILKNFLIDNTRYQIKLARSTLRADQMSLRLQVMTVVNSVKAAYFNLIYARENVKVLQVAKDLAKQLVDENTKKVQLGALAPLDQRQAESQEASSEADLLAAQLAQAQQENTLKSLLALHLDQWADVAPVPAETLVALAENPDLQGCLREALDSRPDMLQAKINVEKQHLTLQYTHNQLYPEIDLTGSYGRNAASPIFTDTFDTLRKGTDPFYTYGVVITIPFGNVAARNSYDSAKASLDQVVLQAKKVETTIVLAVDNDIKTVRSDFLRVDSTRKAFEYAQDALTAGQARLRAGSTTSFEVLQLQSNLTAAHSAQIRALADYNIALEQLGFDDGTILERNHLELKKP